MSQKQTILLLLALTFSASTLLARSRPRSLTTLPSRSLQRLLPPLGMKPLIPKEPVTILDRPLRPLLRAKIQINTNRSQRTHRIQSGETLSKIAKRYYGSAKHWQKIYRANRDTLTNPNSLKTGGVLIIP